jgi:broad specificity phosphatase PhoE
MIYIMRHGKTAMDFVKRSDGWLDLPLSDDGRLGLIAAQQHLKLVPLKVIYAPSLKRTQETAEIIKSGVLSDPKIVTDDAALTWNLGVLAGMSKVYSRPQVRELMNHPANRPIGGESYAKFARRYVPWFRGRTSSGPKPMLIIGSGSNWRLLGDKLFGDPEALNLDEGGLALIQHTKGKWTKHILLGEEDTSHYES